MKKFTTIIMIVVSLISSVNLALAQNLTLTKPPILPTGTGTGKTSGTQEIPLQLPGVGTDQGQKLQQNVLPTITNIVVSITGGLALLFVIISGIQILTAYGNEEKIGEAKKTFTWALIGLLISILSYAIVQIIVSVKIIP
jgi:hypothetical protein